MPARALLQSIAPQFPGLLNYDRPSNSYISKPLKRRNLVLTVDGTSNQFGIYVRDLFSSTSVLMLMSFKQNTNVVELYSRLAATDEQLNYYNSGIGTFVRPSSLWKRIKQGADNLGDQAIAW